MERVTVRIPQEQIDEVDAIVSAGEFPSRSEAVRQAVRDLIDEHSEPAIERPWAKV